MPAGQASQAGNQQLQAMLELERRGALPEDLKPRLQAFRSQGLAPAAPQAIQDQNLEKAANIYGTADKASKLVGFGTTGISGAVMSHVAGSNAKGLRGYIDTLKANLAFDELAKMRAQSPTGGALGSVTEGEEKLLSGVVASLDPSLPDDQLKDNFKAVQDHYGRWLKSLGYSDDQIANATKGVAPAAPGESGEKSNKSGMVETPILEAGGANILGQSDKPSLTVDIHDQTATQSPEFRAGLAKLLADPAVTADQIRDYWAKNAKGGLPDTPANVAPVAPLAVERGKNGVAEKADAVVRGAADAASLGFADEIAAGARTLFGDKTMAENLAEERGVDAYDQKNHGVLRFLGQAGGAAVLPVGELNAGNMARTGALYGGAYGFGSTDGSLADRFIGAGAGAATGAATGFGIGKLGERFVRGGGTPPPPPGGDAAVNIARAANEEGVPVSRPILDPGKRDKMAYLESAIGSGNVVREGLEGTRAAIEARAGKLGVGGTPEETGAFGQRVQGAMDRWMKSSKAPLSAAYDKAAELAGDAPIHGQEAVAKLDEQIANLSRNPNTNKSLISYLQDVRADLIDGEGNLIPKTVGDIRDIRTNLRGDISTRNLTHTPAERLVGEALDAARNDISRDLGQAAPEAERLYRETDIRYKLRAREIKQVVERVIGPDDNRISGGDVMARVNSLARNDTPRLQRLWQKLSPQEQLDGAATIAETAGRMAPDEPFSPGRFVQWSRGIKPSARAVVFGPEGAKSIENLRILSNAYKDTAGRLNNSRSGMVANWGRFLGQITSGGTLGTLVGGVPGTIAGAAAGTALSGIEIAARNLSARALMSRDLTRWLAVAPTKTTQRSIQNWIGRLPKIAANDPAIAQDALGLHKALMGAINDNAPSVTRAAASDGEGPDHE